MLRGLAVRCLLSLALLSVVRSLSLGLNAEAKDLTDVLVQGFSFEIFGENITTDETRAAGSKFAAGLSSSVAPAVTQQFPLASVAPAFTYRYNPAVRLYEPQTLVPGPLFSERALTIGGRQFNFSVGYSFIDFDELNGTDLDNIRSPALLTENITDPAETVMAERPDGRGLARRGPIVVSQFRSRLDLQAHVIVPTLRYGITPYWDVSLTIPIVNTFLRMQTGLVRVLDTDARVFIAPDAQGKLKTLEVIDSKGNCFCHTLDLDVRFIKSRRLPTALRRTAGSATGVGDIALRTKYHLWRTETGGAALGLNLQLPTGEVRNFHGTDETHLSTLLYLSQVFGDRFEPHLNVGVDFNADDVDRSSFLYAIGGTLLVGRKLGLMVDFIGRSEFGRFPIHVEVKRLFQTVVLPPGKGPNTCTAAQPCVLRGGTGFLVKENVRFFPPPVKIGRSDIVNFTFGLRYALGTSGSIFFGGVLPLNEDGLRSNFIPAGGVEYTF